MPQAERWPRLRAIFAWYEALSRTIDQDGIARDYAWNVEQWGCMIDWGLIDPEQYELLHLTFLRSRTAVGNSGRWQALTFSRRGKIILGVGQRQRQAGRRVPGRHRSVTACGGDGADAKKGPARRTDPESFRRGCLKGRTVFALAQFLCKCEEACMIATDAIRKWRNSAICGWRGRCAPHKLTR